VDVEIDFILLTLKFLMLLVLDNNVRMSEVTIATRSGAQQIRSFIRTSDILKLFYILIL